MGLDLGDGCYAVLKVKAPRRGALVAPRRNDLVGGILVEALWGASEFDPLNEAPRTDRLAGLCEFVIKDEVNAGRAVEGRKTLDGSKG